MKSTLNEQKMTAKGGDRGEGWYKPVLQQKITELNWNQQQKSKWHV